MLLRSKVIVSDLRRSRSTPVCSNGHVMELSAAGTAEYVPLFFHRLFFPTVVGGGGRVSDVPSSSHSKTCALNALQIIAAVLTPIMPAANATPTTYFGYNARRLHDCFPAHLYTILRFDTYACVSQIREKWMELRREKLPEQRCNQERSQWIEGEEELRKGRDAVR